MTPASWTRAAESSRRRHFLATLCVTATIKDECDGMSGIQTVSDDEADIRLDRWFRRHFPGVPQSAIQKLCRTGQLRVDGKRVEAATRLTSGQAVRVPPLPVAPRPKPVAETNPAATREIE